MNFSFDIDFPAIVATAMSPDRIQPLLDKAIAEALKRAIDEATGYNSEFRKVLTTQLSEALPHGLRIDQTAKFQHVLNAAISQAVYGANADTVRVAMAHAAKEVMPDVPECIKLSELLNSAREAFHKDHHESFFAELQQSEYDAGGGWLSLDSDESCRSAFSSSIRIGFHSSGTVFSLRLGGVEITPTKMPDTIGRFEGLLLAMYVGRTRLVADIDEGDVSAAAQAQED